MGFRFRRSIRLGRGLRINLSKSGTSLSVGRRGATVNFGPKGEKVTLGLPGTGLSYSQIVSKADDRERRSQPSTPAPRWLKITLFFLLAGMAGTAIAGLLSLPR